MQYKFQTLFYLLFVFVFFFLYTSDTFKTDIFITSLHPSISQAFPVVWSQQELIDSSGLEALQ